VVAERVSLIEKWRLRHSLANAPGIEANATGTDSRARAFTAIAQDPRILRRATRLRAIRIAALAEDYAVTLTESGAAESDTGRAVTQFVRRSIDAWRHSLKAYDRGATRYDGRVTPTNAPAQPANPWAIAQRNFPYVDDETGSLATRILHEFGSKILERARKPWDHVIALAVLRYAARLLRGELRQCDPGHTMASTIDDVLAVQAYAEATGVSPMLVGYSGPGKPVEQALGLLRDARTLRDTVHSAAAGGVERALLWQRAIDFHAFAVVALDHRILLDLPLEDAYELAAAAVRQADAAVQAPELVTMPHLPRGCPTAPEIVRLHAKACLPSRNADET
jgi:hypothetical protein